MVDNGEDFDEITELEELIIENNEMSSEIKVRIIQYLEKSRKAIIIPQFQPMPSQTITYRSHT